MEKMCDNCPFGHSASQEAMRKSLRRGRMNEIYQSVWRGEIFLCHKTTEHDDDEDSDFYVPKGQERECAGAIAFVQSARENRERAERRAARRAEVRP